MFVAAASMISGYSSLTVRSRPAFLRLRAFRGWPRTNWPLAALLETSQYQDPLCSICQNHVSPSRVFSTIAIGKYFSEDQLPMLPAVLAKSQISVINGIRGM